MITDWWPREENAVGTHWTTIKVTKAGPSPMWLDLERPLAKTSLGPLHKYLFKHSVYIIEPPPIIELGRNCVGP